MVECLINAHIPPESLEELWDIPGLSEAWSANLRLRLPIAAMAGGGAGPARRDAARAHPWQQIEQTYAAKEEMVGSQVMRHFEKAVMLQMLDTHWKEHLAAMDYLRQGIHLRGYAQKNPKQEYKREAFEMLLRLLDRIKHEVVEHPLQGAGAIPSRTWRRWKQQRRSRAHGAVPACRR